MTYRRTQLLRVAVIVIALTLISAVIGCGQKTSLDAEPFSAADDNNDSDSLVIEIPSATEATKHFYKEYGEYFLLDADAAVISEPIDSLYAAPVKFDSAAVIDMFMQAEAPTPKKSEDGEVYYNVYDGKEHIEHLSIGANSCSIIYRNIEFTKGVKYPTENFVTQKNYAFSNNGNPPYPTVYKQENLRFMSAQDAVAKVRGTLTQLGVVTTEDVDVFAIDSVSMQAHQAVMMEKDPDAVGFYNIKDQFTEVDEFYILCFTAECGGLPISCAEYKLNNRYISGSEITVYYSKQGIVNLCLSGIYAPQRSAESHEDILTAEEAADAAFVYYNTIINSFGDSIDDWLNGGKYVVIKMELVYAPTSYNENRDEFLMAPAWELTVKWHTLTDRYYGNEYDICDVLTVNAVTGEIM